MEISEHLPGHSLQNRGRDVVMVSSTMEAETQWLGDGGFLNNGLQYRNPKILCSTTPINKAYSIFIHQLSFKN